MSAPKIAPLGNRLLVRRIEKDRTAGGILLPENAKEIAQECEVIAVGPGKTFENGKTVPIGIEPRSRVLVAKFKGNEIELDGVKLVIVNADDVIGVLG